MNGVKSGVKWWNGVNRAVRWISMPQRWSLYQGLTVIVSRPSRSICTIPLVTVSLGNLV